MYSSENNISYFAILISIYVISLVRKYGVNDFVLGTVSSARESAEIKKTVGYFVNTLLFRARVDDDVSLKTFIKNNNDDLMRILSNQDVAFDEILSNVSWKNQKRPLVPFSTAIVLHNYDDILLTLPGLTTTYYKKRHDISRFDLILEFEEINGELSCGFYYNDKLFDVSDIRKLSDDYCLVSSMMFSNLKNSVGQFTSKINSADVDFYCCRKGSDLLKKKIMSTGVFSEVCVGKCVDNDEYVGFVVPADVEAYNYNEYKRLLFDAEEISLSADFSVYGLNKLETLFLFDEIFIKKNYSELGIELNDRDVIFDVGANIGMFTLWANQEAKELSFFCFEPVPQVCNYLNMNLFDFMVSAKVFCVALGDSEVEKSEFFYYPNATILSSKQSLLTNRLGLLREHISDGDLMGNAGFYGDNAVRELIGARLVPEKIYSSTKTLSSFILTQEISRIDLLKIDVEEEELNVLLGIEDSDWGLIRQIILELHNVNGRAVHVKNILKSKGFSIVKSLKKDNASQLETFLIYAVNNNFKPRLKKNVPSCWNKINLTDLSTQLKKETGRNINIKLLPFLPMSNDGKINYPELQKTLV